jgi:hypothetical protein
MYRKYNDQYNGKTRLFHNFSSFVLVLGYEFV